MDRGEYLGMAKTPGVGDADSDHVRIVEEAASWFAKLNDGKPSRRHRDAFAAWLSENPRHGQAYEDIQRLWNSAGELPVLKKHGAALTAKKKTRRQFGIAAIGVAAGALAWRYVENSPKADYATATGERRSITLADGSAVELAAQTRIALAFEPVVRRVMLLEGEAFFNVAASADRPFLVDAAGSLTTALGTAFSVSCYASKVRVVVTEHAVRFSAGTRTARIDAGNRATFDGVGISPPEAADSAVDLAWRNGRLIFTHAPFGEVAATINRWRRGRLIVVGEELARQPVTVIAEIGRLDEVVERLGDILPVRLVTITPWLTLAIPA